MRRVLPLAVLLALSVPLILSGAPAARAEGDASTPGQRLVDAKAASIVSIRFVLKTRLTLGGQSQEQESSQEVRGVLLDSFGFVLTSASHFDGGMGGRALRMFSTEMDMDATPTDLKVLFGSDEKEHPARLVAKDSDLGLAFVKVLDLGDAKVEPLDLAAPSTPPVGSTLLGLTRMGRGFDCAPRIGYLFLEGKVERPRPMWAVAGTFSALGMPVFDQEGKVAGVLTMQQGSEGATQDEGGGGLGMLLGALGAAEDSGLFVLPVATLLPVIERAKARAATLEAAPAEPK